MQLTEHFTLSEFVYSETALKYLISNIPTPCQLENIKRLAKILELIRGHFNSPVKISSGFRCDELNAKIGGAKTSAHKYGLAVDFTVDGVDNYIVFNQVPLIVKNFDQLIYEFGRWVHLSIPEIAITPRCDTLIAKNLKGKIVYERINSVVA